ncbi:hypothetical protein B7760_05687 (plasmid) [Burkholderia glumae]|nr:hypothetical protein B7760_05687 [Burkholderia glumae]
MAVMVGGWAGGKHRWNRNHSGNWNAAPGAADRNGCKRPRSESSNQ